MHRRFHVVTGLWAIIASIASAAAWAQYGFDAAAELESQGSAIRYFGSAKDDKGVLLSDVTVEISGQESAYVFITDGEGQFRGYLPLDLSLEKMTAKCFRTGFQLVRATLRRGPKAKLATVQVDCVLSPTKSK